MGELTRRLSQVEGALTTCHTQHIEGVRVAGVLEGKIEVLTTLNAEQSKLIVTLSKEVDRLTRHEQKNLEYTQQVKSELDTKIDQLKGDSGVIRVGHELDAAKAEYERRLQGKDNPQ